MENFHFATVDLFIIGIVVLSFLVGWIRGATKEILSVVSWVGGGYLAVSLFPYAKEFSRSYISHHLIADFVTACGLFVVFLTILSVVKYFFSDIVKKSILNTTDKVLGGIFGIARGAVILAFLELIAEQCFLEQTPKWMENSKLSPMVGSVSNFIILVLPEDIQDKIVKHLPQIKKQDLIGFVEADIMGNKGSNALNLLSKNKEAIAEKPNSEPTNDDEEFIEIEETPANGAQSAEELATLKPKKTTIVKKGKDISKKERNDMDRILDQYDNIDEE